MTRPYPLESLRNIGFAAHIDAGKTTTTERILYYTGRVHRMGEVDDGAATMDWMAQEKERGITITSAATTCYWRDHQINIIDTPGHVDFTVEVQRSLRVLDGVVIIFCAVGGVQPQSETVWRQADEYHIPRIAFINKMDRIGADYESVLADMRQKLHCRPLPLYVPIGSEERYRGLIDLLRMQSLVWHDETLGATFDRLPVPEDLKESAQKGRDELLETLSDFDETVCERYLEGKAVEPATLRSAIRKATLAGDIVPVVCGAALRNKGIQPLLDSVVDYLPSPADVPPIQGINPQTNEPEVRSTRDDAPLAALVFKIAIDTFVGRLGYVRIYSGSMEVGSTVIDVASGRKERITKLFTMHANKRTEIPAVFAGDIVAVVGLKHAKTGSTLTPKNHPVLLEPPLFPEPVISVAIEPRTRSDEERMSQALGRLADEDPTFIYRVDSETGQMLISGMGELHLDILVDRMIREFSVKAKVGKPQVAYKETITRPASARGQFIRETGGRRQYGDVVVHLEPLPRGQGFRFTNNVSEDVIPPLYVGAIEHGLRDAMENGVIAGYPMMDVAATATDGSYHDEDSTDLAFQIAASIAFKEAAKEAYPTLLEPIVEVEVVIPEEHVGDVMNDIGSRRGRVIELFDRKGARIIKARCPLSEMFGYATGLRSLTQGRGTYTMQFYRYEELPDDLADELLKRLRGF